MPIRKQEGRGILSPSDQMSFYRYFIQWLRRQRLIPNTFAIETKPARGGEWGRNGYRQTESRMRVY
jgi:hypothetical protein